MHKEVPSHAWVKFCSAKGHSFCCLHLFYSPQELPCLFHLSCMVPRKPTSFHMAYDNLFIKCTWQQPLTVFVTSVVLLCYREKTCRAEGINWSWRSLRQSHNSDYHISLLQTSPMSYPSHHAASQAPVILILLMVGVLHWQVHPQWYLHGSDITCRWGFALCFLTLFPASLLQSFVLCVKNAPRN